MGDREDIVTRLRRSAELNRRYACHLAAQKDDDAADEIAGLRELLAHAACPTCDGRGWYEGKGHACSNSQECMERCPQPIQVQCEWCYRRHDLLACEGDR